MIRNLDAVFEPQTYAIAMPAGSSYGNAVDVAVLVTIQDDKWKRLLFHYVGENH